MLSVEFKRLWSVARVQANNIPVTDLSALAAAQQTLSAITGGSGKRRMLQYQGLSAAIFLYIVLNKA